MIIERILIGSSLCQTVKASPAKKAEFSRKQNAIVALVKDRPVTLVVASNLQYRTERLWICVHARALPALSGGTRDGRRLASSNSAKGRGQ